MADSVAEAPEQSLATSDPGERNRQEHVWGDRLMISVGNVVAWLFPILMVAIVTQVIIRKFGFNQAWLDDMQWWMFGIAMLTGFGYAITTESHVRVDIFHQNFSAEKKARIEVFSLGWLLLPFIVLMIDVLMHYSVASWAAGEGSDSPNGLHRLYLLKLMLPVLFVLAFIAGMAVLYRQMRKLSVRPSLFSLLIAALPTWWFLAERSIYYILWWITRFSSPDLHPRAISRQPILEPSLWYGGGLVALALLITFILSRRKNEVA